MKKDASNNYDLVAGIYDRLGSLVFGRRLIEAQTRLLQSPLPGTRIMIAGGGTGVLLEALAGQHAQPLEITFVELSEKMLHIAKRRNTGNHKVQFIGGRAEDFVSGSPFDTVITPFLFDNFREERAVGVFRHLDGLLRPGGTWLFTDFHLAPGAPWWQGRLLQLMYAFFRIAARVEAKTLPPVTSLFQGGGYACEQEYYFCKRFIRSAVYRKQIKIITDGPQQCGLASAGKAP